ncbi:peptide chain release factor [Fragilaria crotonensis]|nr:peptide chain release factor [Fragilaria crotonensis]
MEAYAKTAKARGWKVEILHKATTDIGGIKEASLSITASGGGGSHGYTDDDHSSVDPMVGLGPYGFFKFESGVHRVQRVPSMMFGSIRALVLIHTGRTQPTQEQRKGVKVDCGASSGAAAKAAARELGEARNSLMGGGDRERIRTYNFPQDRVTDHRCKVSEHGIVKLLAGAYEDGLVATFAPLMRSMARDELLQELEDKPK